MKGLTSSLMVAIACAVAGGAAAQNCAGFTDVPAASGFCPNVEWLKNRSITLGCTSATLYCPNDPVIRLTMAAFLNRVGKALTPEVLHRQQNFGAATIPGELPEPSLLRCATVDTAAVAYPRQVVVNASITGLADGNTAAFRTYLLVSTDSGSSYSQLDTILPSVAQRATAAPSTWAGAALTETMDLAPNTTYLFAVAVRRDNLGPATTGNFVLGRCQLTATIFNRNGIASPF